MSLFELFTLKKIYCKHNHTDVNRQSTVGHHCPISERVGLAMNVPPDRYHTKSNTELEESVFLLSSYLLKDVKSIHMTNLHSVCEVARSTTFAAKQNLN